MEKREIIAENLKIAEKEIVEILASGKKLQLEYDSKRQEIRLLEISIKKIKKEEY